MIIKKNLKSEMPNRKRRRLTENDELTQRKKKLNGNHFPLNLLNGAIPVSFTGLLGATAVATVAPGNNDNSCFSVVSDDDDGKGDIIKTATATDTRPPLVRTSRGRLQVMPSRFNDSVIVNWKKDGKNSAANTTAAATSFREFEFEKFEDFSLKKCNGKGKNGTRNGTGGGRGYSELCEEVLHKNFGVAATSKEMSLREIFEETKVNNGVLKKKEGFFGPEDFVAGDIVWAKARKKEPFWPAIVIDAMSQAPELVLRSCIADATCVMFLGYSRNDDHRV